MTLRRVLLTCFLVITLPAAAWAADATDPFQEFFASHFRSGTLLASPTLSGVTRRGWGPRYRQALLQWFHGQPAHGVELSVAPDPTRPLRVGAPVVLKFTVTNRSGAPVSLVTGGSCHSVHNSRYTLLTPDGHVYQNMGSGEMAGHCFCSQRKETVPDGKSVELQRGGVGILTGPAWQPSAPGQYWVIGECGAAEGIAYSPPVLVDVK